MFCNNTALKIVNNYLGRQRKRKKKSEDDKKKILQDLAFLQRKGLTKLQLTEDSK